MSGFSLIVLSAPWVLLGCKFVAFSTENFLYYFRGNLPPPRPQFSLCFIWDIM